MSKKMLALVLALVMLLPVLAAAESVTVTDMYGRTVELPEAATRIVALTAADCEILCALGCETYLVGRGEYCNWPESILSVPVVQSGAETNLEEILALEPQVVLMGDMAQAKDVVDALENSGVRVAVSNADTIQGTYEAIRMIGGLTGKAAEAEALVGDMEASFAAIRLKSADVGKTVYFEVSPLQWGLWAAGAGTFMNEIAHMCGLTNIFADVNGWAAVSEEQVLSRDPDYIVTIAMYFGEGPTPVEEIISRAGWAEVSAVKNGCVVNLDSDMLSRPGPRLVEAAEALMEAIGE